MNTKQSKFDAVIIIPTYTNTKGLIETLRCIEKTNNVPVFVVNNNPENPLNDLPLTDSSDILTEKKNVGFAKACNDGATEAVKRFRPQYIVVLNDDVVFDTDWISACIKDMKKHGWIASVPVLQRPDGSVENVGYQVLKHGKVELMTDKGGGPPDGLTAAALVVEAATFTALGGFDESFFAYLEDVDFFLRLKKAGKTFGVTTSVHVIHTGQQTSSKMSTKKAWLDFRNWIRLINKHWSREEKQKYAGQIILERLRNLSGVIKSA